MKQKDRTININGNNFRTYFEQGRYTFPKGVQQHLQVVLTSGDIATNSDVSFSFQSDATAEVELINAYLNSTQGKKIVSFSTFYVAIFPGLDAPISSQHVDFPIVVIDDDSSTNYSYEESGFTLEHNLGRDIEEPLSLSVYDLGANLTDLLIVNFRIVKSNPVHYIPSL